jgi:hypothetical protein
MTEEIRLWLWTITDGTGKRWPIRYRMTEEQARERYGGNAHKIDSSLEIREPVQGTNFRSPPKP